MYKQTLCGAAWSGHKHGGWGVRAILEDYV
jgi:succinate dehydrogenase hydrophobic anchor subunit